MGQAWATQGKRLYGHEMRNRQPVTVDGETGKPDAAPRQRTAPIKLDTLRNIRDELGRIYREARAEKLPTQDATRLAFLLGQIRETVVLMDLESRIAAIEERSASNGSVKH